MITDERIQATYHQWSARGFLVWYWLLLIDLLYRQFYLHQPVREYWDLGAIFFIGTGFVFLALLSKGGYSGNLGRHFKIITPTVVVTILVVNVLMGKVNTIGDSAKTILGAALGMALILPVSFYLNRRWEKRQGLRDD
ncbi:hypothetical protein HN588_09280 [Candidatus Bathyarchaeota archaeon]|jgi:hypothetical protein|nr:hypothetical protein [Candidatus Bathyarchaeota archaeon]